MSAVCIGSAVDGVLSVVQGKRHQQNLAKRAAREAAEKPVLPQAQKRVTPKKTGEKFHQSFVALCSNSMPFFY